MKQSAFVFGLFAALFGGILLGFMFSPVKNGIDFSNNQFTLWSHNNKKTSGRSKAFCMNKGKKRGAKKAKKDKSNETAE